MACTLTLDTADIGANCPIDMGVGLIGGDRIIFKRKFRWTFEIEFCCKEGETPRVVAKEFVKIGARPSIEIEEVEINYLNGKFWIPGKATWQTITVTYFDVSGETGLAGVSTLSLFAWIATIYDITDPVRLEMNSLPECYEGVGRLILYDGCGHPLEGWLLKKMWPTAVNWGDLDMGSSEEVTVELTLRYSEVEYRSFCPDTSVDKCPCCECPTGSICS